MNRILLSPPHMTGNELKYIESAFETNWVAPLGPNVDAFEAQVAEYVGVEYALGVSAGTAAIHLALCVLGVGPGDSVFCSSFTFVASANPILYQQANPVFIDSDLESWNMSAPALARALSEAKNSGKLPKAVIVANLYGQSANYLDIGQICKHYNVPIIEDAAESLGANYVGRKSGSFGDFGVFSFNGNKIITTSGGGMLVSNNKALIEQAKYLSTQAKLNLPYYAHDEIGYNYRLSNILAGIGRAQMEVLDQRVESRRKIFDYYQSELNDIEEIEWMPELKYGYSNRWLTTCLVKSDCKKILPDNIVKYFDGKGIEVRRVWNPMHQQKLFNGCAYYSHDKNLSVSDYLFERGICLPSGSNMTEDQLKKVVNAVKELFYEKK